MNDPNCLSFPLPNLFKIFPFNGSERRPFWSEISRPAPDTSFFAIFAINTFKFLEAPNNSFRVWSPSSFFFFIFFKNICFLFRDFSNSKYLFKASFSSRASLTLTTRRVFFSELKLSSWLLTFVINLASYSATSSMYLRRCKTSLTFLDEKAILSGKIEPSL